MKPVRRFFTRLFTAASRGRDEARLKEEFAEHIALQTAENLRAGMSPAEARRQAILKFGPVESIKDDYRDQAGLPLLENLWQDTRFAIRQLRKTPAFTSAAVLTLALGMCASVAIFAFVDSALIQPLPYRNPTRLVGVYEKIPLCALCDLSYPDYLDWKKLNTVFTSLEVYEGNGFTLTTPDGAQQVSGAVVSAGFFRTLGISPVLGRDFHAGEDLPSAPRTIILSYSTWQTRYGGSTAVLGQSVTLDDQPNIIIGVLPRSFHFAPVEDSGYWAALHAVGGCYERRSCHSLYGIARLKDGVSVQTALANTQAIARNLERQFPDSNRGQGANVVALTDVIVGDIRPVLLALLTGAGLLLLIASFNVASLLLVRSESRRREIAVRSALGGSAARLLCQFVTEGVILVTAGSLLGLLAAGWAMRALLNLIPERMMAGMPYLQSLGFNVRVLSFAAVVALLAALLFSFTPALRLSLTRMREGLAEGSRGSAGTTWRRLGARLVVLELATAVVLLVGAGLLSRSLYQLLQMDLGFIPDRLATLRVGTPPARYSKDEQVVAVEREIVRQVSTLPGVESVGATSRLPLLGGNTMWIRVIGHPYHGEHNEVAYREVDAGYLKTIKSRLFRGRLFTEQDDASKPHVLIIDRATANKFFPGEDPIGRQIVYTGGGAGAPPMEVVGILENLKEGAMDKENWPTMYVPFSQDPSNYFSLIVRVSQSPQSLLTTLNATIHRIDPTISTFAPRTMSQIVNESPSAYLRHSAAWLVGAFAALALLLSVVGLYGVVAYSVSQRTREIGVRIALGAQRATVYQLILRDAVRLSITGILIGLACSVAAANLIRGLLFGVQPWDIPTLAAVALVLGASAMLASYLPARTAASVNPVEALRAE